MKENFDIASIIGFTIRCRAAYSAKHELILYPAWIKSQVSIWVPASTFFTQPLVFSNYTGATNAMLYDLTIKQPLEPITLWDLLEYRHKTTYRYSSEIVDLVPVQLSPEPLVVSINLPYRNCIHKVYRAVSSETPYYTNSLVFLCFNDGVKVGPYYIQVQGEYETFVPIWRIEEGRGYVQVNSKISSLISDKALVIDRDGNDVFRIACDKNAASQVYRLLTLFPAIDVDEKDTELNSPIMRAAEHGYIDTVKELIRYNAELDFMNLHRHSAVDLARNNHHDDIVKLLIDYGAHDTGTHSSGLNVEVVIPANKHKEENPIVVHETVGDNGYIDYIETRLCDEKQIIGGTRHRERTQKVVRVIREMKGVPFDIDSGRGYNLCCSETINSIHNANQFDVPCNKLNQPILNGEWWFFDIQIPYRGKLCRWTYRCPVIALRAIPSLHSQRREFKKLYLNPVRGILLDAHGRDTGIKLKLVDTI